MNYKKINGLPIEVSKLIQGTIMLSTNEQEGSNRLLDDLVELGVNCFDTAASYNQGDCEAALGNWILDRANREKMVIISKCAHPNAYRMRSYPFDIYADATDSLLRLKTNYIDIFLLHRDDRSMPVGPVIEAMNRLQETGKVRLIGVSNWTADRIEEANEYAYKYGLNPFSVSSNNYCLAEELKPTWKFGSVSLRNKTHESDITWYQKTQMPMLAYSSLCRGWFSGNFTRDTFNQFRDRLESVTLNAFESEANLERLYRCEELATQKGFKIPQIAMAYVLGCKKMNIFALIGARKKSEMAEAIEADNIVLTENERRYLNLED